MDAKRTALAEALLKAIKAENFGQGFYLMAANATEDAKGREIFQTLAAEELDHARFLKAHYDSVLTNGRPSETASLGTKTELTEAWPIFSKSLRDRIESANMEMTSLSVGIQLEQDAMNFYRDQSEKTDDPEARKLFKFLADWEAGHYNALLRQYELLKEDYWSAAGFSPF